MDKQLPAVQIESFKVPSIPEQKEAARLLAASGMFPNASSIEKAFGKIAQGYELGIPPCAALRGIHMVQGIPTLSAALIAGLIDRDPRYDYEVIRSDNKSCILAFYKDGRKRGEQSFTEEDAKSAGLLNKAIYTQYREAMLYNRCMTAGARKYCAGVFLGAVYTAEEIGADMNEDGDVVIADAKFANAEIAEAKEVAVPKLSNVEVATPTPSEPSATASSLPPPTAAASPEPEKKKPGRPAKIVQTEAAPSVEATVVQTEPTAKIQPANPGLAEKKALAEFAEAHGWTKKQLGEYMLSQYSLSADNPGAFTWIAIEETKAHILAKEAASQEVFA